MTTIHSRQCFSVLVLSAQFALVGPAIAGDVYVNIPGIDGEDATPGYPHAMLAPTVTITPNEWSITKHVDSASPALITALAGGTPFEVANVLFYNTPPAPAGPPDSTLDFFDTVVTSYHTLDGITEEITFNAVNPVELFLELPGIPGESDTPGHPNIMRIESFSLTGNAFTIVKLIDSASDDLFQANISGDLFSSARLLLYDALPIVGPPDATIEFQNLLISTSQTLPNPNPPLEQHTLNFATLSQPVPEPASLAAITIAAAMIIGTWRAPALIRSRHPRAGF